MAERGGQPGNKNATKNKLWEDALRRALLAEDGKKLRTLADKLIERAENGDVQALKEVGDRIDGKPTQTIAGDPDNPLGFEIIERVVVDPKGG